MDTAGNNPSSIIIGNCISCQGLVRVPRSADKTAKVRCPHCSEAFPLARILEDAVPELELVDESEEIIPHADRVVIRTESESETGGKFVVPEQLSKGAKRRRRRRRPSRANATQSAGTESNNSVPSDFRFGENQVSSAIDGQDSERGRASRSSESKGRSRQKHRVRKTKTSNTIIEFVKILIGGLLAFPIAYLLVFWGFKQDPLKLGPTISKIAPFAVPAELRSSDETESDSDDESQSDSSDQDNDTEPSLVIPDIDSNGEDAKPAVSKKPDDAETKNLDDGENSDGKNSDGKNSDGKNSDGKNSDGKNSAEAGKSKVSKQPDDSESDN